MSTGQQYLPNKENMKNLNVVLSCKGDGGECFDEVKTFKK